MADPTPILRTADQILAQFDNGQFLHDFLLEHQELVIAMHTHQMAHGGKAKGKVVITLDYILGKQLTITAEADAKFTKPKTPKAAATLWTTAEGELTPQNPQQTTMQFIRDAAPAAQPVRTA